jgi:ADP-heptose:LPS heptosyltransferase
MFRYNGMVREDYFPDSDKGIKFENIKFLTPSYNFDIEKQYKDGIYLFLKSTAKNRTIPENITNKLIDHYSQNEQVRINHTFDNLGIMAHIINNARFVITTDTGPLHVSEALKTPYHALMTNMGPQKFLKYYKYGTYTQSPLSCSPCNWNQKNCILYGEEKSECQNYFSFEFLKDLIDSKL